MLGEIRLQFMCFYKHSVYRIYSVSTPWMLLMIPRDGEGGGTIRELSQHQLRRGDATDCQYYGLI